MSRKEFTKRSRDVVCAQCANAFDRGYAINATRSARPQFCSVECRGEFTSAAAEDRLQARFWAKVERGDMDACWPWIGRTGEAGYGLFDWNNRPEIASRVAFELDTGTKPGELFVLHRCDNPPCCNPAHLWLGTHADNMRDMTAKARNHVPGWRGETHPSAKLSAENVRDIRQSPESNKTLAAQFNITPAAIYNIRNRKTWRDEP